MLCFLPRAGITDFKKVLANRVDMKLWLFMVLCCISLMNNGWAPLMPLLAIVSFFMKYPLKTFTRLCRVACLFFFFIVRYN